ncbi:thermonuclease family protein [Acinetobacter sp. P1(2025)]|uniref:thermonuclease family protein n=1 Tax=Acinetobacter sp. P1(2025) TaxID=3446120 RepID=UPI003F529336
MKIIKSFVPILAMLLTTASFADFSGKVVEVGDGGRIAVDTGKQTVQVNLRSLLTPFPNQSVYDQAKIVGENIFLGRNVSVVTKNKIGDRCISGEVYSNGINLNETLLMTGYAWIFDQSAATQRYLDIEAQNHSANIGLWNPDYHFLFSSIPDDASQLLSSCIVQGIPVTDEKDQKAFYAEKHRFTFTLWVQVFVFSLIFGVALWVFIFWFDNKGFSISILPKRKKKKGDGL